MATTKSISRALAWQIFISASVLSLIVLFTSYYTLNKILHIEMHNIVRDEIASIQLHLDKDEPTDSISDEVWSRSIKQFNFAYDFMVRVVNEKHGVVIESSPSSIDFYNKAKLSKPRHEHARIQEERLDDKTYMIGKSRFVTDENNVYSIYVGLNVTHLHVCLYRYRNNLLIFLLPLLLITTMISVLITRCNLSSIMKLEQFVKSLNLRNLSKRQNPDELPQEFQPLVCELNDMQARFQESYATLVHFSGMLAHELRTPVQHMLVEAEYACRIDYSKEQYRETLCNQIEKIQHFRHLISRLLLLTRINSGHEELSTESTKLSTIFDKILSFMEMETQDKNINIQVTGDAEVSADPVLLQMAFYNCLSNSLRFSPKGADINVLLRR